jgi:DNA-binding protein HU-beta
MNKGELIDSVADQLEWSRADAAAAVDTVLLTITDVVADGDRVALSGFGVFERRERAARTARNPRTGEAVKVKKSAAPAFRPGTRFKQLVNMSKKDRTADRKARTAR